VGFGWAGLWGLQSGALKGRCTPAQGNALGTRAPPPSQHPEGVQQPHLRHRRVQHPVRVLNRGASVSPGRCPGLVCVALSGQGACDRSVRSRVNRRAPDQPAPQPTAHSLGRSGAFRGPGPPRVNRRASAGRTGSALKGGDTPAQGANPGDRVYPPDSTLQGCDILQVTHRPFRGGRQLAGFVRQRTRVRPRGDGSGLRWGLGWTGVSGLCDPPDVRGLPSGALKGRCTPAQGNALGTRAPPPSQHPEGVQ
jgi:hypothetical protein